MNRKERILDFYEPEAFLDNDSHLSKELEYLAVGWRSEDSALATYKAATSYPFSVIDEINRVLDVGSGLGGLLSYLRDSRGYKGSYLGIEILEDFDAYARILHKDDRSASFVCKDFLVFSMADNSFDWAFSLGSLSVHQQDQAYENSMTVRKISSLSKFGFSIFLNNAKMCKNLKGHDIHEFVKMIHEIVPTFSKIKIEAFGGSDLPAKTMIHVLMNK